jgi:hypothetical protein
MEFGQSLDARQTEKLLRNLERAGWLRKETAPTGGRAIHRCRRAPGSSVLELQEVPKGCADGGFRHFLHFV